uniref:Uncharacterized protein n=1 Tax=Globodera rostochiensis TaxID=31243 RepID=A0A914HV42_GLORO
MDNRHKRNAKKQKLPQKTSLEGRVLAESGEPIAVARPSLVLHPFLCARLPQYARRVGSTTTTERRLYQTVQAAAATTAAASFQPPTKTN